MAIDTESEKILCSVFKEDNRVAKIVVLSPYISKIYRRLFQAICI